MVKKLRLGCVLVVGWRSCQRVFQKGMYYLWRAMHERDGEFREVMVSVRPQAQYNDLQRDTNQHKVAKVSFQKEEER